MFEAKHRRWVAVALLLIAAVVIKAIYIHTAERLVDIEEVPIDSLRVLTGRGDVSDFAFSRLYNFNYITNTIFFWVFGYKIVSLKLTSFAFYIISCLGLIWVSRDWFKGRPAWVKWLPFCLVAFGPPVAQIWALKNRGGFIETWAILPWIIFIYGRWCEAPGESIKLALLGVLSGIALWAQPIALTFVLPMFVGVVWESRNRGWKAASGRLGILSLATLIGAMPLIALNFLYGFRTFKVLAGGEHGLGAATPLERLMRLFRQGLPRLVGLKQQWIETWVFPRALSIAFFAIFAAVVLFCLVYAARRFLRDRKFDEKILSVAIICLVLLANVMSSWGSFQGEPRRLLLLYVPLALVIVWSLSSSRRYLAAFAALWFSVSAVANLAYIKANPHGFVSPLYKKYTDVTNFLVSRDIRRIYAGVWVAGKFEFESHMRVLARRNPYLEPGGSIYGGDFNYQSAAIFHRPEPGHDNAFSKMLDDVNQLGIQCLVKDTSDFRVLYGCTKSFDIYRLNAEADQVRRFARQGVLFDFSSYTNSSFPGLYGKEATIVWTEPVFNLPVMQAQDVTGYLCLKIGPQRNLRVEDLMLGVDGAATTMSKIHEGVDGSVFISNSSMQLSHGAHQIEVKLRSYVPAMHGGQDLRSLGLPLETINLEVDAATCGASPR